MDEEVARWFAHAEQDLADADYLLQGSRRSFALFAAQQAVEKALKALQLAQQGTADKTHELGDLAQSVGLPEQFRAALDELTDSYVATRYPVPTTKPRTEETVKQLIQHSKEVVQWTKTQLSSSS